jgi:hypothetical protein
MSAPRVNRCLSPRRLNFCTFTPKNHMVGAHEATSVGHDHAQLAEMSQLAREALGSKRLTALADRGYFNGEEIWRCGQVGITPLVPKPLTSGDRAEGILTGATSSITPSAMNTDVLPASGRSGGTLPWKTG